jgi:hypothetical protein
MMVMPIAQWRENAAIARSTQTKSWRIK